LNSDRLLDRDLALAMSKQARDVGGPVLREVIDYGLQVFQRCSSVAEGHDTPIGVLFPFLHTLEMLDGAEILLDSCAAAPASVTLRSAFEALLSLLWTAAEDSERRGAAYVVTEIHRRITHINRYDPSTDAGRRFQEALREREDVGVPLPPLQLPDPEKERAELRAVLGQEHLAAAAAEYERVKAKAGRVRYFFALWDGPTSWELLAKRVGMSSFYEILYRHWSATAHAEDLRRQLTHVGQEPAVRRLRAGEDLIQAYAFGINIGLDAIQALLRRYRPEEMSGPYWAWYRERVSGPYTRLASAGVLRERT